MQNLRRFIQAGLGMNFPQEIGHYNYRSDSYSYSGHYVGTDRVATDSITIDDTTMELGSSLYGYLHNTKTGYAYVTNY